MDSAQILDTLVWAALTLVCLLNFLLIRRVSRDLDALWDYLGGTTPTHGPAAYHRRVSRRRWACRARRESRRALEQV